MACKGWIIYYLNPYRKSLLISSLEYRWGLAVKSITLYQITWVWMMVLRKLFRYKQEGFDTWGTQSLRKEVQAKTPEKERWGRELDTWKGTMGRRARGNKNKNPQSVVYSQNGLNGEAGWLCWMKLSGHDAISPAISVTIRSVLAGCWRWKLTDLMNGTGSKKWGRVSLCNSFHKFCCEGKQRNKW